MNKKEKLYLMIKIMRDLRGDWSNSCVERAETVIKLATELKLPTVISCTKEYIKHSKEVDDWDGRWFRCSWETGGYEDAPLPELKTFSKELLIEIKRIINYPENALPEIGESE